MLNLNATGRSIWRAWRWLLWALPGLWLRVWLLLRADWLWYDEAFSALIVRRSWAEMFTATIHDVHPPLYYLLLRAWLTLTGGLSVELATRSMSFVFSILALWFYWRLLPRLTDQVRERRIAWLLAVYLPSLIYFSTEARMYALMECLLLGCLWALLTVKNSPWEDVLKTALAGLLLGLLCLTHNAGLYYAVGVAVYLLLTTRGSAVGWSRLLVLAGIAILVWTPWLPAFYQQVTATRAGYWIGAPSVLNAAYTVYKGLIYPTVPDGVLIAGMVILGGLAFWGALARPDMAVLAYTPLIVGFMSSAALGTGAIIPRILAPGLFFAAVGWARLLVAVDVGRVLTVAVFGLFAVANSQYILNGKGLYDLRFIEVLQNEVQPGDVVYAATTGALPMLIYSPAPVVFAPLVNLIGAGLSEQTQNALGLERRWLESGDFTWRRAWLIVEETPLTQGVETRYMNMLIARYAGTQQLVLKQGGAVEGSLWLLER
jgi:hypothetical protein